jgi:hypothetical protein
MLVVNPVIKFPVESDTAWYNTLKLEADGTTFPVRSQFTVANSPTEKPATFIIPKLTVPAEYTPKTRSAGAAVPDATITFVPVWVEFGIVCTDTPAGICNVTCAPPRGRVDADPTVLILRTAFEGDQRSPPPPQLIISVIARNEISKTAKALLFMFFLLQCMLATK